MARPLQTSSHSICRQHRTHTRLSLSVATMDLETYGALFTPAGLWMIEGFWGGIGIVFSCAPNGEPTILLWTLPNLQLHRLKEGVTKQNRSVDVRRGL